MKMISDLWPKSRLDVWRSEVDRLLTIYAPETRAQIKGNMALYEVADILLKRFPDGPFKGSDLLSATVPWLKKHFGEER